MVKESRFTASGRFEILINNAAVRRETHFTACSLPDLGVPRLWAVVLRRSVPW